MTCPKCGEGWWVLPVDPPHGNLWHCLICHFRQGHNLRGVA